MLQIPLSLLPYFKAIPNNLLKTVKGIFHQNFSEEDFFNKVLRTHPRYKTPFFRTSYTPPTPWLKKNAQKYTFSTKIQKKEFV